MAYNSIILTKEEGVALIQMNNPKAMNALEDELSAELLSAYQDVAADPDIGAVILTGAERAFCAVPTEAQAVFGAIGTLPVLAAVPAHLALAAALNAGAHKAHAHRDVLDLLADLHYVTGELMADDDGNMLDVVQIPVSGQITAANRRVANLEQDIPRADLGDGNLFINQFAGPFQNHCLHCAFHMQLLLACVLAPASAKEFLPTVKANGMPILCSDKLPSKQAFLRVPLVKQAKVFTTKRKQGIQFIPIEKRKGGRSPVRPPYVRSYRRGAYLPLNTGFSFFFFFSTPIL